MFSEKTSLFFFYYCVLVLVLVLCHFCFQNLFDLSHHPDNSFLPSFKPFFPYLPSFFLPYFLTFFFHSVSFPLISFIFFSYNFHRLLKMSKKAVFMSAIFLSVKLHPLLSVRSLLTL